MPSDEDEVAEIEADNHFVDGGGTTRMAALIEHIDAFDKSTEQWLTYVERFEHFAEANDVPAEKKMAVFLSVIGATTCKMLRSLLAPD